MKRLFIIAGLLVFAVVLVAKAGPVATSGTTAERIVSNARVYLSETKTTWADNDDFLRWLNNGILDIAAKSRCTETAETVSLVADTIEYSPTTTPIVVAAVIYTDEDGKKTALQRTQLQSIRRQFTGNSPENFYFHGGKIGVYPSLPVVTSASVKIYSAYQPNAIAIGDNVPLPAVYDKALTLYVVAQALLKDRDFNGEQQIMNRYHAEIEYYKGTLSIKENPNPMR